MSAPDPSADGLGAYGFIFRGISGERADVFLHVMDVDRPCVDIRVTSGGARLTPAGDAFLEFLEGGTAVVHRSPAIAELWFPTAISLADLVHPHLSAVAAQYAQWQGMQTMHGGLVEANGVAVAIVGDREAGKSTLLAACSAAPGLTVMADDLVVADGDTVYAGPRTIDLREGAVGRFAEIPTEAVRGSTRHRVILPKPPATARLIGTVVLEWGAPEIRKVDGKSRIGALEAHMPLDGSRTSISRLLTAASRPVWTCSRPKDWAHLHWTVDAVRTALQDAVA